ncbi:3-hydroxybutyrate dehydrogenase [Arthrobacter cryoconiti]|uniref:3-hydroxybutyrate dehydrogenase n=1 Tax=Arthrobacter cryoconiti TaxID=748907 RepID=A0ABV8R4Z4_9MICC|nr:3-hydroxybutyrate dehydrogenase [Arthrobacter cryoconiti]MCC9066785.1 3-hydroxybutyrate dehydrogenase [Arthrobacter cryoconiti]
MAEATQEPQVEQIPVGPSPAGTEAQTGAPALAGEVERALADVVGGASLAGKRALVTGGASGLGAACARALAAQGAYVIVADRDGAGAAAVAADVGGEAWEVDLLDTSALESLKLQVDILINNAGIQTISSIVDFEPAAFRRIITLMLEAPFLLIRAALPHMYEQNYGRIINMSSVHGLRASSFKSAYVAAKHGLEGLSKVTAREGGAHGVTSNCVNPGYVRTPLVEGQIADQARIHGIPAEEVLTEVMLAKNAIKRLVEPEEIANLVAWLASDQAAMVTGSSYGMDGGWSA